MCFTASKNNSFSSHTNLTSDEIEMLINSLTIEEAQQIMFEQSVDDERINGFEDSEVGQTVLSYDS